MMKKAPQHILHTQALRISPKKIQRVTHSRLHLLMNLMTVIQKIIAVMTVVITAVAKTVVMTVALRTVAAMMTAAVMTAEATMTAAMMMAAVMMTGCGAKGDTASQTTQESQTADASTMSGTLDEVKDFMFVVTDAQGASYAFTFDGEKPAGLDDAKIGDKVTVTYTGEISEVDPFEGEVLSVEVSK